MNNCYNNKMLFNNIPECIYNEIINYLRFNRD